MSDQKLEALKATALFSTCSDKQLELIGKVTDRTSAAAGTVLVKQDSVPHQMAILISGSAKVEVGDKEVANLGPGDVVGELAMIDSKPASATVTMTTDGEAWMVARSGFRPVWEQNPDMSRALLEAVVARLRAADDLLA
ncbi:MAG: cyclic nucleotide-binding domain-containing protein [Actinomycetota bacterium]|nr:cyclic nucleotide-binding domain-containing protein [Actinomycetota bacterium]